VLAPRLSLLSLLTEEQKDTEFEGDVVTLVEEPREELAVEL
jgi:hypothetical protein